MPTSLPIFHHAKPVKSFDINTSTSTLSYITSGITKMFRHTGKNLPEDSQYPADLAELGYRLNEKGQFIKKDSSPSSGSGSPEFFQFFISDSERANATHREAFNECCRTAVLSSLSAIGVKPLHVFEDGFVEAKPEGPHVTILTTELEKLKEKKDVVVVVNDHMQDLGIWAYRILHNEGGIDEGSAVGLVNKLQAWGSIKALSDSVATVETAEDAMEKLKLDGTNSDYVKFGETPGVIILNPGQLIYSHKYNKSMSQNTWLARPKKSAIEDNYRIDPIHNRVKGHETPDAHVRSVFEHVIPKITQQKVRLFVVGISDGGESVVKYLDDKFKADPQDVIGEKLEAVALMQSTHSPSQVQSAALHSLLAVRGSAWITSCLPKGGLFSTVTPPIKHYTDGTASQELQQSTELEKSAELAKSGSLPPIINGHQKEGSESSTSTPIAIPARRDSVEPANSSISPISFPFAVKGGSLRSLASKTSSLGKSGYSFPKSAAEMQQSIISLQSNGSYEKDQSLLTKSMEIKPDISFTLSDIHDTGDATTISSSMSKMDDSTTLADSNASITTKEKDPMLEGEEPYAYENDPVSCATFSAGEGIEIAECIWPAVMDDVLEWFRGWSEDAEAREQMNESWEKEMGVKQLEAGVAEEEGV